MIRWDEGEPLPIIGERLRPVLESWRGTPWAEGQRVRGVAAMCFGFVCGVLDELFGLRLPDELVPRDAQMRRRRGALAAMLRVRRFYRPNRVVLGPVVWPGDVVVMGPDGRAAHAAIVGPNPDELWETTRGASVRPTHLAALSARRDRIVRIYRMGA